MRLILAAAAAIAGAGCAPDWHAMDLAECQKLVDQSAFDRCVRVADLKQQQRVAEAGALMAAGNAIGNVGRAYSAPAPAQPAPAPGVPQTYKVNCNSIVGVTGEKTCTVR